MIETTKEHDVRVLIYSTLTGSGVYDAVFEVNGEEVEREFEVSVNAAYEYEHGTNFSRLKSVVVNATCCDEDDEDIADIMGRRLEEAIEEDMWNA